MSTRPFRFGVINEQMLGPSVWLAHFCRIEQLAPLVARLAGQ